VSRDATADLATWLLWVHGEAALPTAFDALLSSPLTGVLVKAILAVAGDRALAGLFEHAASISPPRLGSSVREVRELARAAGDAVAPHVVRALGSDKTAVVAAGCAAAGAGEVWGDGIVARDLLMSCLTHSSNVVRQIALDSCASLRLPGASDAVGALLADAESSVRLQALEALAGLEDVTPRWREVVRGLVFDDPDEDVREAAVKALGTLYDGPRTLDVVVEALGDTNWDPRSEASDVLEAHAEDLNLEQYYRAADATLLLLMAARHAEDATDFTMGVDRLLETVASRLVEIHTGGGAVAPEGLTVLSPDTRELLAACAVMATGVAWLGPTDELERRPDEDDPDVVAAAEFVAALGLGDVFTPGRLAGLGRAGANPEQMAELARRTSRDFPRLGQRLALIAAFAGRGRAAPPASTGPEAPARRRKLHERLRDVVPAHADLERAVETVRRAADRDGIEGLCALYCLAARRDAEALATLERRVLEGTLGRWQSVMPALLALEGKPRGASLLRRIVESPSVAPAVRRRVADNWNQDELGPLPASAAALVYATTAECESLPLPERLSAARELAKSGDGSVLGRLAHVARAALSADDYDDYHFHRDLAAAGHAEGLAHVRGKWIDMGDLEALNALAAVGTLEDLRELERALEMKAPEAMVRRAMDAIRARCAS
jgi:hypothetical protein